MIKILAFSLWAIIATLGVAYLQLPSQNGPVKNEEAAPAPASGETHTFSIALLEKGELIGHLVTRIEYQMESAFPESATMPIRTIIEDGVLQAVSSIGISRFRKIDEDLLKEVGDRLVTQLNEGDPAIPLSSAKLTRTELMMRKN